MNRTTVRLREREQASDREDKLLIVWLIANSDSVSQKLCRVEPRHEDECEEESNNLINVTLCANKICHKPFYFILSNRTTFQHRNKQQNAYLVPQQQNKWQNLKIYDTALEQNIQTSDFSQIERVLLPLSIIQMIWWASPTFAAYQKITRKTCSVSTDSRVRWKCFALKSDFIRLCNVLFLNNVCQLMNITNKCKPFLFHIDFKENESEYILSGSLI